LPAAVQTPPRTAPRPTGAGSAEAPAPKRRVAINAKPWAYIRIDGDPTQHLTPWTGELTLGPHRIHFANPVLKDERTVPLDVPAGDGELRHIETMAQ
ncbi:MAG: hypothetical protein KIT31_41780, partial [Deltaproteobacteria bacterium]|nr:hypothetical protein [Deltaproteobacteria bacterium]